MFFYFNHASNRVFKLLEEYGFVHRCSSPKRSVSNVLEAGQGYLAGRFLHEDRQGNHIACNWHKKTYYYARYPGILNLQYYCAGNSPLHSSRRPPDPSSNLSSKTKAGEKSIYLTGAAPFRFWNAWNLLNYAWCFLRFCTTWKLLKLPQTFPKQSLLAISQATLNSHTRTISHLARSGAWKLHRLRPV